MSQVSIERVHRVFFKAPLAGPSLSGWASVVLGLLGALGSAALLLVTIVKRLPASNKASVAGGLLASIVLAALGMAAVRKANQGLAALRAWAQARGWAMPGHALRVEVSGRQVIAHVGVLRSGRVTGLLVKALSGDQCVFARVDIPAAPEHGIQALDAALAAILSG